MRNRAARAGRSLGLRSLQRLPVQAGPNRRLRRRKILSSPSVFGMDTASTGRGRFFLG